MSSRRKLVSAGIALVLSLFPIATARASFTMCLGSGGGDGEPYELGGCMPYPDDGPGKKERILGFLQRFLAVEDFLTSAPFRKSIGTRHAWVQLQIDVGAQISILDSARAKTLVNCPGLPEEADEVIAVLSECSGGVARKAARKVKKRLPLYTLKIPCRDGVDSRPAIEIDSRKLYVFLDGDLDLGATSRSSKESLP